MTTRRLLVAGAGCAVLAWAGGAAAAEPASPLEAIAAGKPILELRARYASVEQTHTRVLTDDAEALTVRARVGWETAAWRGFRGLVDVEAVGAPIERYAVNVPGAATPPLNGANKASHPVENDPEVVELNRLQLSWSSGKAFQGTVGRQRIAFDDQRFVGNVGWRQDEQTFDALRLDGAWGRVKATYAYVTQANRILGEKRDWDSDSHLAKLDWQAAPQLKLAAFVFALDFANSPANASVTTGVKASGQAKAGAVAVTYNATYAQQNDYRHNTADYGLDYWGGDVAATWGSYTLKASFESLEGDGARSFTTPLATNHAFQGWADAFVQPAGGNQGFADGIEDANLTLIVRPKWQWKTSGKVELLVRYHDFDGQRTGADLGHEWDAQIQAQVRPGLTAALKYADFERARRVPAGAATPPASRTKLWFSLEYRL